MATLARGQPRDPDYLKELKVKSSPIILLRQKGTSTKVLIIQLNLQSRLTLLFFKSVPPTRTNVSAKSESTILTGAARVRPVTSNNYGIKTLLRLILDKSGESSNVPSWTDHI